MFTIKNSIVQELIEEYINEIEDELKTISCVELRYQKGSFIQTKESLMSEQEDWADGDEAKNIDFSQHDFWLTTDDGETPEGFDSIEELLEYFN